LKTRFRGRARNGALASICNPRKTRQTANAATTKAKVQTTLADNSIANSGGRFVPGVEKTSASGEALQEIIQMSAKVGDVISEITVAANQQSDATQQVNTSMSQISQLVQESSTAANQTTRACTNLSNLALDLSGLVNQFRLDSKDDSKDNDSDRHSFDESDFSSSRLLPPPKASAAAAGAQR
jgi:prophage DNA circulation protein